MDLKIVHSNSWKSKPFNKSRPFVRLDDYKALKARYQYLKLKLKKMRQRK